MAPTVEIDPDELLEPGSRDARRLLILWMVRQSAVPVLWVGFAVGVIAAPGNNVEVNYETPSDAFADLLTPAAGIALAILIRLGTTVAGTVLALPLTRGFEAAGAAKGYSGRRLDRFFDRLGIARGYGSLRFTRYVRDAAVARVGEGGLPYDRIDRAIRTSGYVLPVAPIVAAVLA